MEFTTMDYAHIASALIDNMFKCQDKIDGTDNRLIKESNELKIAELKKVLSKVESLYYNK